jgi:hypothetical protein
MKKYLIAALLLLSGCAHNGSSSSDNTDYLGLALLAYSQNMYARAAQAQQSYHPPVNCYGNSTGTWWSCY